MITATAYCLKGNKMANGIYPSEIYIAADSKLYPLGTRIFISGFGERIVGDTGGLIKGNRIDIYIRNCSVAKKFGRRNLLMRIL